MPSYGQKTLAYSARNANSVAVLVGDQVVAFAQTTSHSYGFGTEHLHGIGSALPQEIQQMRIAPEISLSSLALTDAGQQMLAGSNNIAYLLGNTEFDLHVTDGVQRKVLFTYVGCVASNFSENISANRPVSDDIAFLAMDVLDSNGDSVLNTNSAFTVTNALSAAGSAAGLGLSVT